MDRLGEVDLEEWSGQNPRASPCHAGDRLALLAGDSPAFLDGVELRERIAESHRPQPGLVGPGLGFAIHPEERERDGAAAGTGPATAKMPSPQGTS